MAQSHPHRRAGTRLLILLAACGMATGCVASAGASRQPEDPAVARAEAMKKLSPERIMEMGDEAARRREYDRAVTLYNQAIEVEPSADLWYRVAWIYARLGKKPLAAQAFAETLHYDGNHALAHEELGLLYLDFKQRDQARAHLQRAVEIDTRRWRSHNALGVLADAAEDYAAAIGHYDAALVEMPGSALLLNNLGYSHYLAGDLDRAEHFYQKALVAEPGYRPSLANTGLLHARRGDYGQAVDIMAGITDKARACNDVGYVAFQNGDLDQAEWLLREATRLSPSYYETAHDNLKRVHDAQAAAAKAALPANPADSRDGGDPEFAGEKATPVAVR